MEFTAGNIITIIAYIGSFAAAFGSLSQKITHISADIGRLEKKQDLHNGLIARMAVMEQRVTANESRIGKLETYHQQA